MQRKAVQQLTILATSCAIALFAADAWKTKDSSQWTSEDVTKILTDSPWAKDKTVAPEGGNQQRGNRRGMGQGGGIGFPGGGYPRGGGYPGGGYPGGGYPGGGYPGGGYPGGGYP